MRSASYLLIPRLIPPSLSRYVPKNFYSQNSLLDGKRHRSVNICYIAKGNVGQFRSGNVVAGFRCYDRWGLSG